MQTAEDSGTVSSSLLLMIQSFLERLSIPTFWLTHTFLRKSAHVIEFFMQGTFVSAYFITKDKAKYKLTLLIGFLTACTDEFIQLFYSGRAGMLGDILIDFCGTVSAVFFCLIIKYLFFDRRVK